MNPLSIGMVLAAMAVIFSGTVFGVVAVAGALGVAIIEVRRSVKDTKAEIQ